MPKISVLMPVYNNERTLSDALESILKQSFRDFEVIVVDDASTDKTPEILSRCQDPRVRVIRNAQNMKIAGALNRGLEVAQGDYIARMDGDDVSEPERFAIQKAYLDKHPGVGVVGSWIEMFGNFPSYIHKCPETNEDIKALSFFCNPMAHPSVMFRRSALGPLRYSEDYPYAEDWALWLNLAETTRLANIPKTLVHYRVGASMERRAGADEGKRKILKENAAALGLEATHAQWLEAIADHNRPELDVLEKIERSLLAIYEKNRRVRRYPEKAFKNEIGRQWFLCSRMAWSTDRKAWIVFLKSPLCSFVGYSKAYVAYLRIKETTVLGAFFKKVVAKLRWIYHSKPWEKWFTPAHKNN